MITPTARRRACDGSWASSAAVSSTTEGLSLRSPRSSACPRCVSRLGPDVLACSSRCNQNLSRRVRALSIGAEHRHGELAIVRLMFAACGQAVEEALHVDGRAAAKASTFR